MDKYKTSELGRALKKVFRGEMSEGDSISLAEREISEIFRSGGTASVAVPVDTGKVGEIVGVCPICGKNVIRGNSGYGCMGYKEGCNFRIGMTICKKTIPINEIKRLLATGSTVKLSGFVSKSGKLFSGKLILKENNVTFSFD